ncbi:MAG TPA: hypothetical protein VK841_08145 [Polyangiaceae bacterium]|nr:hypothetical protein [Polyangiaceae bacterium]
MRQVNSRLFLLGLAVSTVAACSDTGDTTSIAPACSGASAVADAGGQEDNTVAAPIDASRVSLGTNDTGASASIDGASMDVSVSTADTGVVDASTETDGGEAGSHAADGGTGTAGTGDATIGDAGASGGAEDAGVVDVNVPVLDAAAITASCEAITGLPTCSATAFAFAEHDPTGECLTCLVNLAGALDDNMGDVDNECGDLPAAADQMACLATLDCIIPPSNPTALTCVGSKGFASDCYCGAGVDTGTCAALTTTPVGQCTDAEAAGLDLPAFPPTPVLNAFTNTSLGSGVVNAIFAKAQTAKCTTCY